MLICTCTGVVSGNASTLSVPRDHTRPVPTGPPPPGQTVGVGARVAISFASMMARNLFGEGKEAEPVRRFAPRNVVRSHWQTVTAVGGRRTVHLDFGSNSTPTMRCVTVAGSSRLGGFGDFIPGGHLAELSSPSAARALPRRRHVARRPIRTGPPRSRHRWRRDFDRARLELHATVALHDGIGRRFVHTLDRDEDQMCLSRTRPLRTSAHQRQWRVPQTNASVANTFASSRRFATGNRSLTKVLGFDNRVLDFGDHPHGARCGCPLPCWIQALGCQRSRQAVRFKGDG